MAVIPDRSKTISERSLMARFRAWARPRAAQFVPAGPVEQRLLVLVHGADEEARGIQRNAMHALQCARLAYDVFDLAERKSFPDLDPYASVVIATTRADTLPRRNVEDLAAFVQAGGGLAILHPGRHPGWSPLMGLETRALANEAQDSGARDGTIRFVANLYPGLAGLEVFLKWVRPYSDRYPRIDAECEVLAVGARGEPLGWRWRQGRGCALCWNSDLMAERDARGILLQSILSVQRVAVAGMANAGVIQVDDFPAGFVDQNLEPARSEFGMSLIEFLDQVWLPDMLEVGREFSFPYTFFIPFTYNELTSPPFDFREWEAARVLDGEVPALFSLKACRAVRGEGEMGFHGYNHVPLTAARWGSSDNMMAGLNAAMARWQRDDVGPLPNSYVPAMNEFDEEGARALTEAIPSLRTVCSAFQGSFDGGAGREFGAEPWNPSLFAMPRVTYGYEMTPQLRLYMVSSMATMGVWTHFVHPDDVFDNPLNCAGAAGHRNPSCMRWREGNGHLPGSMLAHFRAWFEFASTHYPWLRYEKTSPAADRIRRHLANRIHVELSSDEIRITSDEDTHVQIRINDQGLAQLGPCSGAELLHRYRGDGYDLYTFQVKAGTGHVACKLSERADR